MQNQTQNLDQDSRQNKNQEQTILKESLSLTMPKLIMIVGLIVCIGAMAGWIIQSSKNNSINIKVPVTPNAKCSICKAEFTMQCQKCKERWQNRSEEGLLVLEAEVNACMHKCFGTNYPFTADCGIIRNKCEEFGVSIIEEIDETADLSSKALATEDWQTYRNEEYGFEFKYPKEWNIIDNKRESIPEGAPYVKIENKKDFKVRNFSIEIMLVNKEGAEMPAGMVFRESTKIVENKTTGEKMYFKIVANSCVGGICWRADQEEQAMKDTELFSNFRFI